MQVEDFLLSIKEEVDFLLEVAKGDYKYMHGGPYSPGEPLRWNEVKDPAEQVKMLKRSLETLQMRVKNFIEQPDKPYRCGLYISDGSRQYGYSFEQLEHLMDEYEKWGSPHYKCNWGFSSLCKWLYEVSRTSIGDLHGDLPKHVVVTYHRPADFDTDAEYDEVCKRYDTFWDKVDRLFGYKAARDEHNARLGKSETTWQKIKNVFKRK